MASSTEYRAGWDAAKADECEFGHTFVIEAAQESKKLSMFGLGYRAYASTLAGIK